MQSLTIEEPEPEDFELVYETDDPMELNLIQSFLSSAGIEFLVFGEDLLYLKGGALPFFSGVATIYLQKKDHKILFDFLNSNQDQ